MNISDNILKYHLRNTYFIGGTACGGKTTMARRLAEKHGFALYTDGMNHDEHKKIAQVEYQPAMSKRFTGWDEYFNRPYTEYAQWLTDTIEEDAEMVLADIMTRTSDQKVVVDAHMPLGKASQLVEHKQIVFLVAEPDTVVNDYFTRADHKEILDCIMSLPDPYLARKNVEKALVCLTERFLHGLYKTDWFYIMRDANSTIPHTLDLIEQHLGLV